MMGSFILSIAAGLGEFLKPWFNKALVIALLVLGAVLLALPVCLVGAISHPPKKYLDCLAKRKEFKAGCPCGSCGD